MIHVICYSGGHSSAIVAIEVVRKFGKENCVLLNHDINPNTEDSDIKRFKQDVADYLGMEITYANFGGRVGSDIPDQFDVCIVQRMFKSPNIPGWCTYVLKTQPFEKWISQNCKPGEATFYYGFDGSEKHRLIRRRKIIEAMGFLMEAPLIEWDRSIRTINQTLEIGITPPGTYSTFKHANCVGCLKAKKQHWYCVYCLRPDIWAKAKLAEAAIGYSIMSEGFLDYFESTFKAMRLAGVEPTEQIPHQQFWRDAKKKVLAHKLQQRYLEILMKESEAQSKPCECSF